MKTWMRFLPLILLAALLFDKPQPAAAQTSVPPIPAKITIEEHDNPLVITGKVNEANAFVGNLRLIATGSDVAGLIFLPSDLKRAEASQVGSSSVIGRQNVTVLGDTRLQANLPKDFQVNVTGIRLPGVYTGLIQILQPGQSIDQGTTISLTITAWETPLLAPMPGSELLKAQVVNCNGILDCALSRWVLPESAFLDQWTLQMANNGHADAQITEIKPIVIGQINNYPLEAPALKLSQNSAVLPAAQITPLLLQWDRSSMPPDHYTGALYLTVAQSDARQTIPVDIQVRSGAALPVLLILLGILLGRLFQFLSQRGLPQANALSLVNELSFEVSSADPQDQKILQPMVEDARQDVYHQKLVDAQAKMTAIRQRMDVLKKLRLIQASIPAGAADEQSKQILQQIDQARLLIAQGQDQSVTVLMSAIQSALGSLGSTVGTGGEPNYGMLKAYSLAGQASYSARGAQIASDKLLRVGTFTGPDWGQRIKTFFISLAGMSSQIQAETIYWFIRPLAYATLLIFLVYTGLNTLYVKGGVTFGSSPADYVGLILWGLSSDVAGRATLGNPRVE